MDGFSTITRTVARSVTADGHTSNMSNSAISGEPRPGLFQQAPDIRNMNFHIPDAEVGGLLEYRYERVYTDPLLVDPWIFGDAMPVVRSEFTLVTLPEAELDYAYGVATKSSTCRPRPARAATARTNSLSWSATYRPLSPSPSCHTWPMWCPGSPWWCAPCVVTAAPCT